MSDYTKLRSKAKQMYICEHMNGREIGKKLDVSEVTVSRWVTQGNWKVLRAEYEEKLTAAGMDLDTALRIDIIKNFVDFINENDTELSAKISFYALSYINQSIQ